MFWKLLVCPGRLGVFERGVLFEFRCQNILMQVWKIPKPKERVTIEYQTKVRQSSFSTWTISAPPSRLTTYTKWLPDSYNVHKKGNPRFQRFWDRFVGKERTTVSWAPLLRDQNADFFSQLQYDYDGAIHPFMIWILYHVDCQFIRLSVMDSFTVVSSRQLPQV